MPSVMILSAVIMQLSRTDLIHIYLELELECSILIIDSVCMYAFKKIMVHVWTVILPLIDQPFYKWVSVTTRVLI